MEIWLWAAIGILTVIIIALCVKVQLLKRSAREIEIAFADRLVTDMNILIDISGRDKYMRAWRILSTGSFASSARNAAVFSRAIWN